MRVNYGVDKNLKLDVIMRQIKQVNNFTCFYSLKFNITFLYVFGSPKSSFSFGNFDQNNLQT